MLAPLLFVLAIAYPLVSHLGVVFDVPALPILWLGLVLAGGLLAGSRSPLVFALALLCLTAALFGSTQDTADWLPRVPPVAICFSLAWIFGRTLLPDHTPLISRIGERMRGRLPERVAQYGRRLTLVWTLFLGLLGLESLLLGLYASPFWWSLFTNLINYVLIALLFVLEYPIRRRVLRDLELTSFIDSLRGSLRFHSR
ncbi:hypothetical protein [Thiocystis violascens]|uniref:Putative membrane protein n=1 Tax=Thiocystis violascens (strain ATCC 17096 / DSM 198 / 6111) TaxID=765911 RepID=I3YB29_THIV6|nr:hypothetical protein [Thiocystis violascens]AFL74197.1 putative membrane protein [Thiocystis violascens DSM 198]